MTPAVVGDHIERVRLNPDGRLDLANVQPMCREHHNGAKQFEERRGYSPQVASDGWPVDPRHPANRGRV